MKKLLLVGLPVFIAMFFLASCSSEPPPQPKWEFVVDQSLTDNEMAIIYWWGNGVRVTSCSGMMVTWKVTCTAKIPGGNTQFLLSGSTTRGSVTWRYKYESFDFDFENGKEYSVWVRGPYVFVYDGNSNKKNDIIALFDMRYGQLEIFYVPLFY